jgi:large subunit ribosomal protein L5
MTPRLLERYRNQIVPDVMQKFSFKNPMQVPRLSKIVINMGCGPGATDIKILEAAMANLAAITGQKPVIKRAKKSISNFKLKQNAPIACMVTLRRNYMYEFLDRLISVAIPRIKDFRGLSKTSFDERGNYTLGLTEQLIFPEVDYDTVVKVQGMNVTIVTNAKSRELALELLKQFGVPFREK